MPLFFDGRQMVSKPDVIVNNVRDGSDAANQAANNPAMNPALMVRAAKVARPLIGTATINPQGRIADKIF